MPQAGQMGWADVWGAVREDLWALIELAAPTECAGCSRPAVRWCDACAQQVDSTPPRWWSPTPRPTGMPPTWSGPAYDAAVRNAVVAWKDRGRNDLTRVLAPVLADSLAAALVGSGPHLEALVAGHPVLVIPAPSSAASTRARGEHLVAALARAACTGTRLRPARAALVVVPALRLGRRVADQSGLDARRRRENLRGAVVIRSRYRDLLTGAACVVVDDVVTTGSTLTECARALREARSGPVVAATIAATARSQPVPHPPLPDSERAD